MALQSFDPGNRMDNPPMPLNNQAEVYARNGTNFLAFNAVVPRSNANEYQTGRSREAMDAAMRNRRIFGDASGSMSENMGGSLDRAPESTSTPVSPKKLGAGTSFDNGRIAPMAFTLKNVQPNLDDTLARRGIFAFKYKDIANPYAYADQYNFDLGGPDRFKYGRQTSVSDSGHESQNAESAMGRPRKAFGEKSLAEGIPESARRNTMVKSQERAKARLSETQVPKARPRKAFDPGQYLNPTEKQHGGNHRNLMGLRRSSGKNSAWRGGLGQNKPYNADHNKYITGDEQQGAVDASLGVQKVVTSHHRHALSRESQGGDPQKYQPSGSADLMDNTGVLWPSSMTSTRGREGIPSELSREAMGGEKYGDENLAKYVRQSRDYTDRYNNLKPAQYSGKGAESEKLGASSERLGVYDPEAWGPNVGRGRRNSWKDKDANHAYDTYGYQQRAEWIRTNGNPSAHSMGQRNRFGLRERSSAHAFQEKSAVFQVDNMQCPDGQMLVNGQCVSAIAPGKPVCLPGWDYKDGKCHPRASV